MNTIEKTRTSRKNFNIQHMSTSKMFTNKIFCQNWILNTNLHFKKLLKLFHSVKVSLSLYILSTFSFLLLHNCRSRWFFILINVITFHHVWEESTHWIQIYFSMKKSPQVNNIQILPFAGVQFLFGGSIFKSYKSTLSITEMANLSFQSKKLLKTSLTKSNGKKWNC